MALVYTFSNGIFSEGNIMVLSEIQNWISAVYPPEPLSIKALAHHPKNSPAVLSKNKEADETYCNENNQKGFSESAIQISKM